MALPERLGCLGIVDPSLPSDYKFNASRRVTSPLRKLIKEQDHEYSYEALTDQMMAKSDIRREKSGLILQTATIVGERNCQTLHFSKIASVPGSSSWLMSLPIEEHGFCLHKGAFVNALALRYGWTPLRTPTKCVCVWVLF